MLKKKHKYFLVQYAESIGKITEELNLKDMLKFCKRRFLNEKSSKNSREDPGLERVSS